MTRISYFVTVFAAAALLTACDSENTHGPRKPGVTQNTTTTLPEQKPDLMPGDAPVIKDRPTTEVHVDEPKVDTIPVPPPATGTPDYAIKVPGKPGYVRSPYTKEEKLINVQGLPPGTEAKDPYTDRTFLVP